MAKSYKRLRIHFWFSILSHSQVAHGIYFVYAVSTVVSQRNNASAQLWYTLAIILFITQTQVWKYKTAHFNDISSLSNIIMVHTLQLSKI